MTYVRVASAEIVNRTCAWRAAQRRSAAASFSLFAVLLRGAALDRSAVDARGSARGQGALQATVASARGSRRFSVGPLGSGQQRQRTLAADDDGVRGAPYRGD